MEEKENFRKMMEEIANLSQLWNVTLMCSDGLLRKVVKINNNYKNHLANQMRFKETVQNAFSLNRCTFPL